MRHRRHFSLWYMLLGCLGLVTAHSLSYVLAAPDAHVHAELLTRTGHGSRWWVVAVVISLVMTAASRLLPAPRPTLSSGGHRLRTTFARLAAFQIIGFGLLETIERAGTGALASLAADPVMWLGAVVQVLVALAATAFLYVVVRVSRRRAAVAHSLRPTLSFDLPPAPARLRPSPARAAWNLRGPPALLSRI